MQIAGRRGNVAVIEQSLNGDQVDARFEQVSRKGMSQPVNAATSQNAGTFLRSGPRNLCRLHTDRLSSRPSACIVPCRLCRTERESNGDQNKCLPASDSQVQLIRTAIRGSLHSNPLIKSSRSLTQKHDFSPQSNGKFSAAESLGPSSHFLKYQSFPRIFCTIVRVSVQKAGNLCTVSCTCVSMTSEP